MYMLGIKDGRTEKTDTDTEMKTCKNVFISVIVMKQYMQMNMAYVLVKDVNVNKGVQR